MSLRIIDESEAKHETIDPVCPVYVMSCVRVRRSAATDFLCAPTGPAARRSKLWRKCALAATLRWWK